jgi:hypothetical protein
MTDIRSWSEICSGLSGRELEGVAFMPMRSDTPDVVARLHNSILWFSGAVELRFVKVPPIFITWQNAAECSLIIERELSSQRSSMDYINANHEGRWGRLTGAALDSISLFTTRSMSLGRLAAAKFDFRKGLPQPYLWIGTGNEPMNEIGEGDDLFVGLDSPPNMQDLEFVMTVAHT